MNSHTVPTTVSISCEIQPGIKKNNKELYVFRKSLDQDRWTTPSTASHKFSFI